MARSVSMKKKNRGKRWLTVLIAIAIILVLVSSFYLFVVRYTPSKGFGSADWSKDKAFNVNDIKSITLKEGQTDLKIVQLADLHLKFGSIGKDKKTIKYIDLMLEAEKPDLCVATGDMLFNLFNEGALNYFCKFMESKKQPWAFVFGNHDSEIGLSKYRISKTLDEYDYCLYSAGPKNVDGAGNYFINIKNFDGDIVYTLAMLDSQMYPADNKAGGIVWKYDGFKEIQVQWYEWMITNLQKEAPGIQSLAFFHMPIQQFQDLYKTGSYDGDIQEDADEDTGMGIYPQGTEVHFFDKVKELGSTKAIFVGHDHANTMRGYYDGIFLCYGKTSGYSTYPVFKKNNWIVKMLKKSDKIFYNAELLKNGRGFTVISVQNLDYSNLNYGSFSVRDIYHKDM